MLTAAVTTTAVAAVSISEWQQTLDNDSITLVSPRLKLLCLKASIILNNNDNKSKKKKLVF